MDFNKIIANNLATYRAKAGYSVRIVARYIDYSESAYWRWERGQDVPRADILYRIAEFYEVPIEKFFEKSGGFTDEQR